MIDNETLKHTYSDNIYNKKIAVLGNYPPPLGGVSVHIKRVIDKFRSQKNTIFHFDTTKRKNNIEYTLRLLLFLFKTRPHMVYYHTLDLNTRLIECKILLIVKKIVRYQLVLVEHNCRYTYAFNNEYKKQFSACIKKMDKLVLIGHSTLHSYIDCHITMPDDTSVQAAFLPPSIEKEDLIINQYPLELLAFLDKHWPLIIANASQIKYENGMDLYGIDACIQAIHKLKQIHPNIGFVCLITSIEDKNYFDQLQLKIKMLNLTQQCYFLIGQYELWPILKKATLFVRPTLSDGDSVSVQEALYFGISVVASDASKRPSKVVTFSTGDAIDFYNKVCDVLSNNIFSCAGLDISVNLSTKLKEDGKEKLSSLSKP